MGNDTHVANVGGVVHEFTELLSCKVDHFGQKKAMILCFDASKYDVCPQSERSIRLQK